MDFEEEVGLIYLAYQRYRKKHRSCWVQPLLTSRLLRSSFHTLFEKLVSDETKFLNFFRMSPKSFDELLCSLKEQIQRRDTQMRAAISAEERLTVTLRHLGSGYSITDLHYKFRMGRSTIRTIVKEVCILIWQIHRDRVMSIPSTEKWREIAAGFLKYRNFPNCVGALDSIRIRVMRDTDGSVCLKYNNSSWIMIFATIDYNYNFTYVDVCFCGETTSLALFKETSLNQRITSRTLNIPDPEPFPNTCGPPIPYAFVANAGFALTEHILRPYAMIQCRKDQQKKAFNHRVLQMQQVSESAFALLCNKWQIFHNPFTVSVDFVIEITKACAVLHNFVLQRDGYSFEDTLIIEGLEKVELCQATHTRSAASNRNMFANYFANESGTLPLLDQKM